MVFEYLQQNCITNHKYSHISSLKARFQWLPQKSIIFNSLHGGCREFRKRVQYNTSKDNWYLIMACALFICRSFNLLPPSISSLSNLVRRDFHSLTHCTSRDFFCLILKSGFPFLALDLLFHAIKFRY